MPSMRSDTISADGCRHFGDDPSRPPGWIHPSFWEGHRDQITQLFCVENKSFLDIQSIMESEHDFFATLGDYMTKILSEWHLESGSKGFNYQYRPPLPPRQVGRANEKTGSSAVPQTGKAARRGSGKTEKMLRDPYHMTMSSLSKRHSSRSVDEDVTYTKEKQLATNGRAEYELRKTNRSSQTVPETKKTGLTPAKDSNGKFPCTHCTKTYLHANHLKRHLLQHTEDRPYMCGFCRDTFSRSDLLRLHVQKCSISRGNPTDVSDSYQAQTHLMLEEEASINAENSKSHFVSVFDKKFDMQKVNVELWILGKIGDILREGVDIHHPTIKNLFVEIERNRFLDINSVQIVLQNLRGAETSAFCEEFWQLCRSSTSNSQDNPNELLAGRELEIAQENIAAEKTVDEALQSAEIDEHDSVLGSLDFPNTQFQKKDRLERLASTEASAISGCNQNDCESAYVFDNFLSPIQFLAADQYAQWSSNDSALSDGESTDTGSAWMSDYSGVCSLGENHPFNLIKPIVVEEGLLAYQNAKQRTRTGSSTSATSGTVNTALGAKHIVSSPPKKRSRNNQDGSEEAGDSEDDEELPAKRGRTSKRAARNLPSFACPFAKKNPLKYRGCYAYVLKRVRDVKQHLSRFHQLPIYCPRCTDTFEAEDERDEHIRASSCLVQHETITFEGVTRAQKILLGQRVSAKMTSSDQWFTIFDILFPGHTPRPKCAFINTELSIELEAFQDLMYAEGPRLISSAIRSSGLDITAMENVEDDSTALLQSAIQEGLQQTFQQWSANMPGIEQESTDSKHTTTDGSSTSPACPGIQGSELSRSSSKTLVEDIQERNATTKQNLSFREYARNQEHALPQGMSASSKDMVADAFTLLPSNTNQQNSNQIRNADIQPVIPNEDVIEDAAHFGSLATKSWGVSEVDIFESNYLWNLDPAFDEARRM